MSNLAGDYADSACLVSPAQAQSTTEPNGYPHEFTVICDDAGAPVELLAKGSRAPLALIDASLPMRRLMAHDSGRLFGSGIPALVVVDESRAVGVITPEIIDRYKSKHPVVVFGITGDELLPGDAHASWLVLTCSACGTRNSVTFFTPGQTECTEGHLLAITWE
jgi:hypothetical protein